MLQEIEDRVYLVPGRNRGQFPFCNSLYIKDETRVLIDAGAGQEILQEVKEEGVDLLVFTHFHRDHVSFAPIFSGTPKAAHFLDAPPLESLNAFFEYTGLNQNSNFMKENKWLFKVLRPEPVQWLLKNGEVIDCGRTHLKLMHTPGHTPGHSSFLINDKLFFAADIDLTSFGPWYGNVSSSLEDFIHSINLVKSLNPSRILTSHMGMIEKNIPGRLESYLDIIEGRERAILERLKKGPHRLEDLTGKRLIYPNYRNDEARYRFERIMLYKHLEKLIKTGRATKQEGYYKIN